MIGPSQRRLPRWGSRCSTAVIAVALYAAFYAGLLATVLACLAVSLLWPLFVAQPFIEDRFDLLEMAIFAVTCGFIAHLVAYGVILSVNPAFIDQLD